MRVYTVHHRAATLEKAPDVALIKEGFSWPALFFGFIWALWRRLWVVAIAFFVINAAAGAALLALGIGGWGRSSVMFVIALGFGLWGNDVVRWTLKRRGYVETDVVTGTDTDEALRRCLDESPFLMQEMKAA